MTFLLGDTGKSQFGSFKTFTITPGTARETLLGTPLTLPTTEPATSQVIMTVQTSDLPTILPSVQMKFNASLVCSGKIGVSASVINYRVLKNGVSIAQTAGTSATATQFWTHTHWRTFDVVVGDVLEVRYWAVQADVNLDFYGLLVYPSQPEATKRGTFLKDLNLTGFTTLPNFTTTTSTAGFGNLILYPTSNTGINSQYSADTPNIYGIILNTNYGLFRNTSGEHSAPNTTQLVHATLRQIQKQYYPQNISFREVLR